MHLLPKREEDGNKQRVIEPLVLCATLDASMHIQEAAKVLHDERLQIAVQGVDLIAMDVVYHKTCYRDKTRQKTLQQLPRLDNEKSHQEGVTVGASSRAFATLARDLQRVVVNEGKVHLTQICRTYVHYLSQGGEVVDCYRVDLMKNHLEQHFGDLLHLILHT